MTRVANILRRKTLVLFCYHTILKFENEICYLKRKVIRKKITIQNLYQK